jgi:septal ring factor EnvC (AmiA/AmiB activator)
VDKAADLEDDLRAIRTASPAPSSSSSLTAINNLIIQPAPSPEPPFPSTQSRLASFLAARRPSIFSSRTSTPTRPIPQRTSTPNPNLPLEDQLQQERSAREIAEEKVASMTTELEELTQSLFEEANAMVRTERQKSAQLEAKLQIMESREEDKRRRLTELEKAISRITRVRNLLDNNPTKPVSSVG